MGRTNNVVRFGVYEIDRLARELRRCGERIPLQIQPFSVLEILLERAGEVVTREELRAKVWPSTVYVDFDHGLNNAMTRLRHALADSSDSPKFIKTLPRVGYSFIHPLQEDSAEAEPAGRIRTQLSAAMPAGMAAALVLALGMLGAGLVRWVEPGPGTSGETQDSARLTANADAHEAYLRGIDFFEQRSQASVRLSIEHLARATELDPGFAAAYAALAMAYTVAGGNTLVQYLSVDEAYPAALAATERALRLDPGLARSHVALAGVLNQLQPWSAANDLVIERSFRDALRLDPEDADARLFFGNFLASRGRSEEAVAQFESALAIKPLSPSINSRLGMELMALGDNEAGLEYLQKTVELDPYQYNAQLRLAWGHITLGEFDAAETAFRAAEHISPGAVRTLAGLAFIAARRGDEEQDRSLLAGILPLAESLDDPFEVAIVYVGLEDRENAIEWLSRTARHTRTLHRTGPWGMGAPVYDWLRDDARFAEIERQVGATATSGRPDDYTP
jgi:DNA-binding winged helix-turn-helix (wHTH) protein/Tfp pilus assembly protein PilF